MNNKETKVSECGLSRRQLIQAAGAAMIVSSASPSAFGDSLPAVDSAAAAVKEDPRIFKLLYLWLAVSTNKAFGPNGNIDTDTISKKMGIAKQDVEHAISLNSSSAYKAVTDAFEAIANDLKYTPGQCPANFTTLEPISQLKPK